MGTSEHCHNHHSVTRRELHLDFTLAPGSIGASNAEMIFLAPGDDDGAGFAERYEFYHHEAFTDRKASIAALAIRIVIRSCSNYTTPLEGGEREAILLTDLTPNSGHCVFMVAFDDYRSPQFPRDSRPSRKNRSLQDLNPTAPAQILDLIAEPGTNDASLDIRFTAVGDDGQDGRAAYYEVVVITEAEYNASGGPELGSIGLRFSDPEPLASGSQESRTLTELNPETTYAVFIRAVEEEDNRGSWSPPAFGSTAPVAPNPPTALSCSAAENTDLPTLECEVTEPGDEGELGTEPVSALEVFISTDELDEDSLDGLVPVMSLYPAVRLAGQVTEFSLSGLTQNTTYSIGFALDELVTKSCGLPSQQRSTSRRLDRSRTWTSSMQ